MSTINFLSDKTKLSSVSTYLLSQAFPEPGEILVKIHFGEPGNPTGFFPEDVAPIIDSLKKLGLKPTLIDTPVAYDSPRNTPKGYYKVAQDRGFTKIAPVIISDNYLDIKTKDLTVKVCAELTEAKNLLVISHIKGHPCAGFGGAIKNFGMGGVGKVSKSAIHNGSMPIFTPDSCTGCGTCARLCPANAITIENKKAVVDLEKCMGCSICQLNCPTKSLVPKIATFDDLLAQGASACINHLPKNTYYINFIQNITKSCDCESNPGKIIAPDVGILFSNNPVAIDTASVDLIGPQIFTNSNHKNPYLQLQYASQYTQLPPDYQLNKL